jgi:plasmid stability protein
VFNKIAIRNIPSEIFGALEALADLHDRSTEAEARHALRAWVEPTLVQASRNTRRKGVAERLNRMLAQINSGRPGAKLTTSHIAEAIKEERAEDVEDWFLGEKEPSFSQLSAIAKFLGVDQEWLKHGDKALFPTALVLLSEDPSEAVNWLLSWNPPTGTSDSKVKHLHLIRGADSRGGLYIVKECALRDARTAIQALHKVGWRVHGPRLPAATR